MTLAAKELSRLEQNYPPPESINRCLRLISILGSDLPPAIHSLLSTGMLSIGELGLTAPNANTKHFSDGSHLILFNSGLMDFILAVCQTLFGATREFVGSEKIIEPVTPLEGIVPHLAAIYSAWKSGQLWNGVKLQPPSIALSEEACQDAENLAMTAELFFMAHEFGHVSQHHDNGSSLTLPKELEADATATRIAFKVGQRRGNSRMFYAGATVALRVLSGLERLGHKFPGFHPAPAERLLLLRNTTRSLCQTEDAYWRVSTIAIATDELMEAAENVALGLGTGTELTMERMFSRLSAILEECAKGRLVWDTALNDVLYDVKTASPDVLREVADISAKMFLTQAALQQPGRSPALRKSMAEVLERLIAKFPGPAMTAFVQAKKGAQ